MTPEIRILKLIRKVDATTGSKEKESILKNLPGLEDSDIPVLKSIISYTYDRVKYSFGTTKTIPIDEHGVLGWSHATTILNNLCDGYYSSKNVDEFLEDCSMLSLEAKELMDLAIGRSLRCGVGPKTFSKIFGKDVISVTPYMRCTSFSEKALKKIKFPCISQLKSDGRFVNIIIRKHSVTLTSRNGEDCSHLIDSDLAKRLMEHAPNHVIHGEILVSDGKGGILNRSEGNGYLNSDEVDTSLVMFECWDIVGFDVFFDGAKSYQYVHRYRQLSDIIDSVSTVDDNGKRDIALIRSVRSESPEDVKKFFMDVVSDGFEGLVVKNMKGLWKNGTSGDQIKVKVEVEGEVLVVDITEGKGKYEGKTGALVTMSSCGEVQTNVAGLTDKEREDFWKNPDLIVGKVITVRYNDVTYNETTKKHSLYLPRLVEVRTDKDTADDLKTLRASMVDAVRIFG